MKYIYMDNSYYYRGHFSVDINDAALKRTIIEHGPCRSKDPKYFYQGMKKKLFFGIL